MEAEFVGSYGSHSRELDFYIGTVIIARRMLVFAMVKPEGGKHDRYTCAD